MTVNCEASLERGEFVVGRNSEGREGEVPGLIWHSEPLGSGGVAGMGLERVGSKLGSGRFGVEVKREASLLHEVPRLQHVQQLIA